MCGVIFSCSYTKLCSVFSEVDKFSCLFFFFPDLMVKDSVHVQTCCSFVVVKE